MAATIGLVHAPPTAAGPGGDRGCYVAHPTADCIRDSVGPGNCSSASPAGNPGPAGAPGGRGGSSTPGTNGGPAAGSDPAGAGGRRNPTSGGDSRPGPAIPSLPALKPDQPPTRPSGDGGVRPGSTGQQNQWI